MRMENATTPADPRPLTEAEHDLVESLLGAVRSGVGKYIGQLPSAEVVGRCRCGCPSVELAVDGIASVGRPTPLVVADAESPEGIQVGVILWARDGRLSGLEVHAWDGSSGFRLPRAATLHNLRKAG